MCDYCEGKKAFNAEYIGCGAYAMKINHNPGFFYEETIARIEDGVLFADTSSGEYASRGFKINFCPKCGAKLKTSNKGSGTIGKRIRCAYVDE